MCVLKMKARRLSYRQSCNAVPDHKMLVSDSLTRCHTDKKNDHIRFSRVERSMPIQISEIPRNQGKLNQPENVGYVWIRLIQTNSTLSANARIPELVFICYFIATLRCKVYSETRPSNVVIFVGVSSPGNSIRPYGNTGAHDRERVVEH